MTARQNGQASSIKMVCNGGGNAKGIEYLGMAQTITYALKSTTDNPSNFGDMMEYVGYATINGTEVESQRITQAQVSSQTIVLQFEEIQLYIPVIATDTVSGVTTTSATCGGNVTYDGGATVINRGVCFNTTGTPTINNTHTTDGNGLGSFVSLLDGLTPHTEYYVRAYATNSVGTAYGEERSFTTASGDTSQDGLPCPGVSTLTDIDGNTYNTVQIGTQCWMKENLRTTQYADSTPIAQGSEESTTTAYWYYPNNSSENMSTYGLLYNWKAVMGISSSSSANTSGAQGICPTGWHVPNDMEWTQLTNYVSSQSQYVCGSTSNNIAKALAGTIGWNSSTNTCAVGNTPSNNNATGFSALPAGIYGGFYSDFGNSAYFWSSAEHNNSSAYYRSLTCRQANVYRDDYNKSYAFSVRCVLGSVETTISTVTTAAVIGVLSTTAVCGGNVTSDGGATVTARGVCWSTTPNPTISDSHTSNGTGTGSFTSTLRELSPNTTYYVRAYATNGVGTAYGNEVTFITTSGDTSQDGQPCSGVSTLIDIDGNTYNTVQIGTQCWMKENLRTTKYADNTTIDQGSDTSTTTAYWYYPNDDTSNMSTYGLLYNWKAVMGNSSSSSANPSGVQGICPTGWHVPSDAEWKQMEMAVGMTQNDADSTGYRGDIAARLCGNTGWTASSNANAAGNTYATGRNSFGFSALPAGNYNGSYNDFNNNANFWSATEDSSTTAYNRSLEYNLAGVYRGNDNKYYGYSVRCVRDEENTTQDGLPCPGTPTLTDIDGNAYNTVQIGTQCWMKENLRTTKYADNTPIAQGSEESTTTAYWCYPNNSSANWSTYGLLYNWKAVMRDASSSSANPSGVQGICPTGWHVPSYAEWTQLTDYVSSRSEYVCGNVNTYIAKALADTTAWDSYTSTCAIGNTPSNNNTTGFSAIPAGFYLGYCNHFGNSAYFWSSTEHYSNNAYRYYLTYYAAEVYCESIYTATGYSVRCVHD